MVGACQQNSGIFLVRGGEAGDLRCQAAGSERDACGYRGWAGGGLGARCRRGSRLGRQRNLQGPGRRRENHRGRRRTRSEMPAGRNRVAAGRDGSGQMPGRGRCRGVPRLGSERNLQGPGRRQPNHLKRKRSIISSSNSGFSKSFSLVMIKLLCSQNPASW